MAVNITSTAGYLFLDSWVWANIIQLETQEFCDLYLNQHNDPCGRQYDQMTQAARSVTANIAEGSSRHQTSRETEMKLIDVARASLSELSCDYMNFLLRRELCPWHYDDPRATAIRTFRLDAPNYNNDLLHEGAKHILQQKARVDAVKKASGSDAVVAANILLIICGRLMNILRRQLEYLLKDFKQEGGFTENMTQERLASRTQQAAINNAPTCPLCGKTMVKRVAKKGHNSGHEFWSCSDYPACTGTRPI